MTYGLQWHMQWHILDDMSWWHMRESYRYKCVLMTYVMTYLHMSLHMSLQPICHRDMSSRDMSSWYVIVPFLLPMWPMNIFVLSFFGDHRLLFARLLRYWFFGTRLLNFSFFMSSTRDEIDHWLAALFVGTHCTTSVSLLSKHTKIKPKHGKCNKKKLIDRICSTHRILPKTCYNQRK